MDNDNFFTLIDEQEEQNKEPQKETTENTFVTGLPDWDLEPPYKTIKRGEQ